MNAILIILLGIILSHLGIRWDQWEYWAILIIVALIICVSHENGRDL